LVRARVLGPRNGLHPTVKVMATAKRTASEITPINSHLPSRFIVGLAFVG
jgi:hypothetical protein